MTSQVGDLKTKDGIQKVFNLYDTDCNQFVSTSEFSAVARSIHDCISEAEIDEMVHNVFINWETSSSSGLVFDEFYQVVSNFVQ
jgi:Ca2+-binding EF-hand superfamily protein